MYTLNLQSTLVRIAGTYLPAPTKYDVQYSDLDSSDTTRNELGELIRNRIRAGVVKIFLEFLVDGPRAASLMQLVAPAVVLVEYMDPYSMSIKSGSMYVGDRACVMKRHLSEDSPSSILWQVSFNLIEY